jgi:hypothetical protein
MEFASAIIGFVELCSWAQSRGQGRARILIRLYVAGRRVKVVCPCCPCNSTLTRRPAPETGFVGFDAWRIVHENCAIAVADYPVIKRETIPRKCFVPSPAPIESLIARGPYEADFPFKRLQRICLKFHQARFFRFSAVEDCQRQRADKFAKGDSSCFHLHAI